MEKYIQQLSTFTTDDKWCHLLSSLWFPASDILHNSQKCICPNVPRVPMCPRLPYIQAISGGGRLAMSDSPLYNITCGSGSYILILGFRYKVFRGLLMHFSHFGTSSVPFRYHSRFKSGGTERLGIGTLIDWNPNCSKLLVIAQH